MITIATRVILRDLIGPVSTSARNVVIRNETIVSDYGIPSAQLTDIATQQAATINPI